jgi:hypothetical protein
MRWYLQERRSGSNCIWRGGGGLAIKTEIEHEQHQKDMQRGRIDADSAADPGSRQAAQANIGRRQRQKRKLKRNAANSLLVCRGGGLPSRRLAKPFLVQMVGFRGETRRHESQATHATTDRHRSRPAGGGGEGSP